MEIRTKFNIKDIVYLITDEDQKEYFVTSIIIDSQGIMYTLRSGTTSITVYDFEISLNKRY